MVEELEEWEGGQISNTLNENESKNLFSSINENSA